MTGKTYSFFVNPDMTRKEQLENYNLRQELKRRRDEGETNLVIRRNEIVVRDDAAENDANLGNSRTRRTQKRRSTTRAGQGGRQGVGTGGTTNPHIPARS